MSVSARYVLCQVQSTVFDYYTNEQCSSVTLAVDSCLRFSGLIRVHMLLCFQNFMDHIGTVH